MSYAVISDVHANLEALEAVLGDIERRRVRGIYFLGDAVGYGPSPNECVALLEGSTKVRLAGNHDWAAIGLTDAGGFNPVARAAIEWTATVLTDESREAIGRFSLVKVLPRQSVLMVHSSPLRPEEWHYVFTLSEAELNFSYFKQRTCLIGHSHQPFVVERLASGELRVHREEAKIVRGNRYLINVGSVGQPRDRDPRACYALLDGGSVRFVRVEYAVGKTQAKMREAGLPQPLIERLSHGL
jgi:diadenosine tetraphosphatase ApaH/serine/threonine PP2A family protein phosphatase